MKRRSIIGFDKVTVASSEEVTVAVYGPALDREGSEEDTLLLTADNETLRLLRTKAAVWCNYTSKPRMCPTGPDNV